MTAATVIARRFLVLPVTVKTGVVTVGRGFEELVYQVRRISCGAGRRVHQLIVPLMTKRAVVVVRFLVIRRRRLKSVMRRQGHRPKSLPPLVSNYVLMFIVGKLDRELSLVFRFGSLPGGVRFAECETRLLARRRAQMANGTDCRPGAAESLPGKKL